MAELQRDPRRRRARPASAAAGPSTLHARPETPPPKDREIVGSVLKAFEVLRVFGGREPELTLSEVAEHAGISRASARRFLLTFTHAGYMESDGKRFRPTPKLLELTHAVTSSASLWDNARPIVSELSSSLGESCFGAVLDGTDVLYVMHVSHSARYVNVGIRVGSRLPAYCTSLGRVLLSGLSDAALDQWMRSVKPVAHTQKTVTSRNELRGLIREARRLGWAIVDEELEIGLRSVSAPIRTRTGEVVAALNVCGPSVRVSLEEMRSRFVPELVDAAARIGQLIRG
jgi:IclR family pca regulon transcriptional regulator